MSSSSSPNLVLELNHHWLRYAPPLLLLTAALVLPWLATGMSILIRSLCMGIGSGIAITALWRAGLWRSVMQLSRVSWDQQQRWQLQFGTDKPIGAILLGRSWCSPWVLCLKFRTEPGYYYQLLLWRTELTNHAWHQWLLRLRQEGGRRISDAGIAITP